MTSQTFWTPPPYADVVFHPETFALLGVKGVGALAWFMAHARQFGAASWGVDMDRNTMARSMKVDPGTLRRYVDLLNSTNYITTVEKQKTGTRGNKSQTHYLTYHPALEVPPPNGGGPSRGPSSSLRVVPTPTNAWGAPGEVSVEKSSGVKNAVLNFSGRSFSQLEPSPPHDWGDSGPEIFSAEEPSPEGSRPVVEKEIIENNNKQNHQGASEKSLTPAVLRALKDIGWNFRVPIPPQHPPDILIAIITYARNDPKVRDPARFVAGAFRDNTVMSILQDNGLLGRDPNGRLPRNTTPRMDPLQFEECKEQHPQWAETVLEAARRQAIELGRDKVPPSLILEVAAATPLPPDVQAGTA